MATRSQAISVNAATLKRLKNLPKRLGVEITSVFREWEATQMSDVHGRFAGRPGLVSRTGNLLSTFKSSTRGAGDLNKLTTQVGSAGGGQFTKTGQGYARVQEFGAIIRPLPTNRSGMLRFELLDEPGTWLTVRKSTIPPRLHFYDSFRAREAERMPQVLAAAVKAINGT